MRLWVALALVGVALFAQPRPRVVLIDIDGIRRDTLEAAVLSGKLKNFERVVGKRFSESVWFENATAMFPAITMASQASLFTGVPPSRHGIPGNHWFDRSANRTVDYFSSTTLACVYGVLIVDVGACAGGLANRQLNVPTIYDAATKAGKTSIVAFSQYWKGATHAVLPSVNEVAEIVRGNLLYYQRFDELMMDRALGAVDEHGLPDLLTLYFIGADYIGHSAGIAAQAAYLERGFDNQIGRLVDVLERRDPEWKGHTQFVITSDHGRTDAKPLPEDRALEGVITRALERSGYLEDQFRIVENGGVVHLYLRSKVIGARWQEQPRIEDVARVGQALAKDATLAKTTAFVAARTRGAGLGYVITGTPAGDLNAVSLQLSSLESERSGDIVLLLKPGRYMGNQDANGAQHGSIHPNDLAIPLVIAQGGAQAGRSPVAISTVDVAKIIGAYLGF